MLQMQRFNPEAGQLQGEPRQTGEQVLYDSAMFRPAIEPQCAEQGIVVVLVAAAAKSARAIAAQVIAMRRDGAVTICG